MPDKSRDFEKAISKAEGYGKPGTIPTRRHNPGDLKLGGKGVTTFPDAAAGRRALHNQIRAIDERKSHIYNPDMTLQDMGHKYTTTDPEAWTNTVANELHVKPITPISEILHGPPPVVAANSPEGLYNAGQHEAGHAVVDENLMPGSVQGASINRGTGSGITNLYPRPIGGEDDVVNNLAGSLAGVEAQPSKDQAVMNASGDVRGRSAIIGGLASTPINNLRRLITGGTGKDDIMVKAPQLLANAQARVQPILADPRSRQQMNEIGSRLNEDSNISGDDIRRIVRPVR